MSWKRIFYVLFVGIVALMSATFGAALGAKAVLTFARPAAVSGVPAYSDVPAKLQISNTEIETAITQAVEGRPGVGPIGTVPSEVTNGRGEGQQRQRRHYFPRRLYRHQQPCG
jgi:hypothetical protein